MFTFKQAKQNLNPKNNIQIGRILKPHGYKGHLTVDFKFDPLELQEESVLVRVEGWLVPFFIDYENSNLTALKPIVKFFEVNDEDLARKLAHKFIFLPRWQAEKYLDLNKLNNLIGYSLIDINSGIEGTIIEEIDVPKNPLVKVIINNQEYLIPTKATETFEIDHSNRTVKVKLPKGILNQY